MGSFLHVHFTCDYKARINPCVHRYGLAKSLFHFGAYRVHKLVYFPSRPNGSYWIILVSFWHTKESHDSIANELLNKSLIFVYYVRNLAENVGGDFF